MTVQRLKLAVVAIGCFAFLAAAPGVALAASKCDAGLTKAAGKKVSCLCVVYAKSYAKDITADPAKLQKCTDKFTAKCTKATSAADCSVQTQTCPQIEAAADGDVAALCISDATTTTTTPGSTTTTTMGGPCCGINPTKLNFTTSTGSGNCGTVQLSNGTVSKNLACSGLFTGGGGNTVPLPYAVPDMGSSLTGVSACSGTALTLANVKSNDAGATNRNCTSVGCLFGPPLPIPNAGSPATSVCVINSVTTDATGTADCSSGASHISLPLNSEIFLTGDIAPDVAGLQPCPVCLSNVCH